VFLLVLAHLGSPGQRAVKRLLLLLLLLLTKCTGVTVNEERLCVICLHSVYPSLDLSDNEEETKSRVTEKRDESWNPRGTLRYGNSDQQCLQ